MSADGQAAASNAPHRHPGWRAKPLGRQFNRRCISRSCGCGRGWPAMASSRCGIFRLFTHDADAALERLQADRPARVYLVTLGRDSTAGYDPAQVRDWLVRNYRLVQSQGYAEQDETYRRVKSWLLRREAYRYKVVFEIYRP